jgi:hypothetical protein
MYQACRHLNNFTEKDLRGVKTFKTTGDEISAYDYSI